MRLLTKSGQVEESQWERITGDVPVCARKRGAACAAPRLSACRRRPQEVVLSASKGQRSPISTPNANRAPATTATRTTAISQYCHRFSATFGQRCHQCSVAVSATLASIYPAAPSLGGIRRAGETAAQPGDCLHGGLTHTSVRRCGKSRDCHPPGSGRPPQWRYLLEYQSIGSNWGTAERLSKIRFKAREHRGFWVPGEQRAWHRLSSRLEKNGVIRYRGYPIEELTERSIFVVSAYLLMVGALHRGRELSQVHRKADQLSPYGFALPGELSTHDVLRAALTL